MQILQTNNNSAFKAGAVLLVHSCCAPCSAYVYNLLSEKGFFIEGFFYNPNIHPDTEQERRLYELIRFAKIQDCKLNIKEDKPQKWLEHVKGFEACAEGGERCQKCFELRLEETAKYAKDFGFDGFCTVMSVSPHKNAEMLNKTGITLAEKYGIRFLETDFKKDGGFKKSVQMAKEFNFYRQNYCGCKFSIRET